MTYLGVFKIEPKQTTWFELVYKKSLFGLVLKPLEAVKIGLIEVLDKINQVKQIQTDYINIKKSYNKFC